MAATSTVLYNYHAQGRRGGLSKRSGVGKLLDGCQWGPLTAVRTLLLPASAVLLHAVAYSATRRVKPPVKIRQEIQLKTSFFY